MILAVTADGRKLALEEASGPELDISVPAGASVEVEIIVVPRELSRVYEFLGVGGVWGLPSGLVLEGFYWWEPHLRLRVRNVTTGVVTVRARSVFAKVTFLGT